jgi:Mrp family chromosome partitioning ATPase
MLADPGSRAAEPFRALRTSVDLAVYGGSQQGAERRSQVILLTSALEGEGRTTTVANLAVALARTGRHVVLADLDFERPSVAASFGVDAGGPGVIDVALGTAPLTDALVPIESGPGYRLSTNGNAGGADGLLEVLPAGEVSPLAGELAATAAFERLFALLRGRADVVLVDAPPLLGSGDGLALSSHADAIVVVIRYPRLRRPSLLELRRVLQHSPARAVGFVLTESAPDAGPGDPAGTPVPDDRDRTPIRA